MQWQCALLQRWLPEYPDGNLPVWAKGWLTFHVARCSACRQELAELREVVAALEAAPVADPGPEFWREFSRDMHLLLVKADQAGQVAPAPASPRGWRLPYLLGAPALAVLLLYVTMQLTGPGTPLQDQAMAPSKPAAKVAAVPKRAPAPVAEVAATPPLPMEQYVPAALEEGLPLPVEEADISDWDLDAELAGMTDQEKDVFLNKLHQHKKDGSCFEGFSLCSWG